jgi:hypothetical protein
VKYTLGIDPGMKGGWAVLCKGEYVAASGMTGQEDISAGSVASRIRSTVLMLVMGLLVV